MKFMLASEEAQLNEILNTGKIQKKPKRIHKVKMEIGKFKGQFSESGKD